MLGAEPNGMAKLGLRKCSGVRPAQKFLIGI